MEQLTPEGVFFIAFSCSMAYELVLCQQTQCVPKSRKEVTPTATTFLKAHHISSGRTILQSLSDRFDYGKNPEKTLDGALIRAYECDPMTADAEFLLSKTQRIVIHYNCIGAFEVPDRRKIQSAEITMKTRKGVAVSYTPTQIAV